MRSFLIIAASAAVFYLCLSLLSLAGSSTAMRRERARSRVGEYMGGAGIEGGSIMKEERLSQIPWLRSGLARLRLVLSIERMHAQANLRWPVSVYVLMSLLLLLSGFILAGFLPVSLLVRGLVGLILAAAPFVWIKLKRDSRMARFEKQLPEALDLISRALKAGHTITSGLKLVADEFDDPVGTEFDTAQDEINFGLSVREALHNLNKRLDSDDLNFFVIAVNIQSETGGNLGEVLENIVRIIRERFKFRRKVKVLTAEARISAAILLALPFLVMLFKAAKSPDDLPFMLASEAGRLMLYGALGMMALGVLVIRKMIRIET